jgi:plasmid stabilization system protein ParE
MAQIRWSLTAGIDLQEIEDFIARDSLLHAINFIDRIIESAETLLRRIRA